MNFSRRQLFLGFGTTLAFLGLKNNISPVQAQSVPALPNSVPPKPVLRTLPPINAAEFLQKTEINREPIYQQFLQLAAAGVEDKPALLYQGISTSPYQSQINNFAVRLQKKPDGKKLVDGIKANTTFKPYPKLGELPIIDEKGLKFLHEDIKEACICVGSFSAGNFQVKWLGRDALANDEYWSSTKIIPMLNVISRMSKKDPNFNFDNYKISGIDQTKELKSFPFYDLARDIVTYEQKIASSNSLAAMFKRFSDQVELEKWLKSITGNNDLVFRGRYGEKPFIDQPQVLETKSNKALLEPFSGQPRWVANAISAYDLTRVISTLGWYNYIPPTSRLPFVQWQSLTTLIRALGTDCARLTDLAIQTLGLQNSLESVVIISKLGNGATGTRQRTEAVYVALVQFIDNRPVAAGKPPKFITLTMALRGTRALNPRDLNREVVELDARMATEVTEIIRRAAIGNLV